MSYQIGYTYHCKLREQGAKNRKKLSTDFLEFYTSFGFAYRNGKNGKGNKLCAEYAKALDDGKPSDFFRKYEKETKKIISGEYLDLFYDCVDMVTRWQISDSIYRRSFRTPKYGFYQARIGSIMQVFEDMSCTGVGIQKILKGDVSEEFKCYENNYIHRSAVSMYALAVLLERGDKFVEAHIEEKVMNGESVSVELIRAILMSRNEKMFKLLEKYLLAARLQEGLRQVICENLDYGTKEAFLYLFKVILDNDLTRFASVMRAISTYTGLFTMDEASGDRITKKQADLIYNCLNDENERQRALNSSDHMECFIGLWSIGFSDITAAFDKAVELIDGDDRERRLSAAYFIAHSDLPMNSSQVCTKIFEKFPEDYELQAVLMNGAYIEYIGNSFRMSFNSYDKPKGKNYPDHRVAAVYSYYFDSIEECERAYKILYKIQSEFPKKKIEYNELVFPWNKCVLKKSDYITRMIYCASACQNDEWMMFCANNITECDPINRADALRFLLTEPRNDEEYEILTKELGDAETYTRKVANALLKSEAERLGGNLPSSCYQVLEDLLKLKKADTRACAIELLMMMDDNDKLALIERLLTDKGEEKRAAGLDILLNMKKEDSPKFKEASSLTSLIASPSTKEKILIDEINNTSTGDATAEEGFGFFDPSATYTPVLDEKFYNECIKVKNEFLPKKDTGKELKILLKLDQLIEDNKEKEFTYYGGTRLVGQGLIRSYAEGAVFPLYEIWDKFYDEEINDPRLLTRLYLMLENYGWSSTTKKVKGGDKFTAKYAEQFFGDYINFDHSKIKHYNDIHLIINYLYSDKEREDRDLMEKVACAILYEIYKSKDMMIFTYKDSDYIERPYGNYIKKDKYERTILTCNLFGNLFGYIRTYKGFPLHYALCKKYDFNFIRDCAVYREYERNTEGERKSQPCVEEYMQACIYGVISKDFFYKEVTTKENMGYLIDMISGLMTSIRDDKPIMNRGSKYSAIRLIFGRKFGKEIRFSELGEEDKPTVDFIKEVYETVVPLVINKELKRGDSETDLTQYVRKINCCYGVDYFVGILSALGKQPFNRSKYISYYNEKISKQDTLSILLDRLLPDPDKSIEETAEELKAKLKGTDIKEKRLIETAMFAPDWLPVIAKIMECDGFVSGCYYFMAHMNEYFDDRRKAMIAKYSPISADEFNNGAFDKDWFDEVYKTLGEKKFDELYDAAKYISDGAKHSRARKYSDAATGKMEAAKTLEEIMAKRNKDLLMAYAIIPGSDKELTTRYQYIRQFIKESKKFGSQRRASEKLAGETAIKNMATANGYSDETRFILKMENDIASELQGFWTPKKIDDVEACLTVDSGKVSIQVTKDGKALKSVPAKLKKNEDILDLTEAKTAFTEQYRRTKILLEESMESQTPFTVSEIEGMRNNPVLKDMVEAVVFECKGKYALIEDIDAKGDVTVVVAHPYKMFKDGVWKDMQQMIYDKQIAQPFKQVFRELYVKTAEEKEAYDSRRYAGNQIQPQKTVAVLKTRRWVADMEDGLQKIYYKENIIATIYALADWFSPSDVEAPTLEWVSFIDRKTFQNMKIADVPDIIFSEVMRDVDLAVSVAHAGQIDPEMSHSTVEMRRVIAEFTAKLFKLDNVHFTETHAIIKGQLNSYTVHLGSGVVHLESGLMLNVLPVHSQRRGRIFLPFVDDDPKTSEIMSKILLFADDKKIKDPFIIDQIKQG
ncbi:MAG: DUF4132 domain-containing protein [Clostridiales bacterium]|nr:DUF4132 domain-containing protein [Clostridiales bacterium]